MDQYIKASSVFFGLCAASVMLTSILASGNAVAGEAASQGQNQLVKYQELNLNSATGVATLYHRITVAAEHVCNLGDSRELARVEREKACVTESRERAIAQVNVPALSAYLHTKTELPAEKMASNVVAWTNPN